MKKDVFFAIVVGFVLGSLTALLAVNLPFLLKSTTQPAVKLSSVTPTIIQINAPSLLLTIDTPLEESIVTANTINVSGKIALGTILVVDTDSESQVQEASSSGSFSFPAKLGEGANTIIVTAYNGNGESEQKTLTVFYTREKL